MFLAQALYLISIILFKVAQGRHEWFMLCIKKNLKTLPKIDLENTCNMDDL